MISRAITRGIISAVRLSLPTFSMMRTPQFNFGKIQKVTNYKKIIDTELKEEEANPQNLQQYETKFKTDGWTVTKENTLVELRKKIGNYQVSLLSNIRSPTNFGDEGNEGQEPKQKTEGEEEENPNPDMSQITILVTKEGTEKTMMISTVVTDGFEISNISFAESYAKARSGRFDIFNSNQYTGPQIDTLPENVFQSIYGFLQETLGIQNELMNEVADYCLDSEHAFYIEWLKDIKSIL